MNEQHIIHCPINSVSATSPDVLARIAPLIEHLKSNMPVADTKTFPCGTAIPDGRLDLCKQGLGITGCQMVTDALIDNSTVISFLLGTNGIGNIGAASVAKLIEQNDRIEIVYLGCNRIDETGIAKLTAALTCNTSVTGLWLKRNPIGDRGRVILPKCCVTIKASVPWISSILN